MMRALACMLAAMALLSGCSTCDPEAEARGLAGPDAQDCGYVPLGRDPEAALACAETAWEQGRAFHVGVARQGIDSELRTYIAVRADGTAWALAYDGDPSGGGGAGARLTAFECTAPPARFTDGFGRTILTCPSDGTRGVTLCDR